MDYECNRKVDHCPRLSLVLRESLEEQLEGEEPVASYDGDVFAKYWQIENEAVVQIVRNAGSRCG